MKIFLAFVFSIVIDSLMAQDKSDILYKEKYRPQFHFSPAKNWINDPNGLVYHNGKYHLFFQHNPFGNEWGHMSWGHASSKDLIHWENLPVAIPEEKSFMIFSGSAVSDIHNTSGFAKNKEIPIVAMYTAHTDANQSQHLAYSLDNGRSWQQYANNPVIDLHKKDFRDPNVSWYAPSNHWLLAVSQPVEKMVSFYSSNNLKEWKWMSDFGPAGDTSGVWECPDLMQVPIANEEGKKKWVLLTSQNESMQYFVGEFDGKKFINENPADKIFRPDYGPDYYAAIAYHQIPGSENPVAIGWINNWDYANDIPTSPWKGAMALPRKLSLKKINDEWVLLQEPLSALQSLRLPPWQKKDLVVNKEEILPVESTQCEIEMSWKPSANSVSGVLLAKGNGKPFIVGYDAKKNKLFIDRTDAGDISFSKSYAMLSRYAAKLHLQNGLLRLHIFFDNSIVEVFANDGEAVLTAQIFSDPSNDKIALFSNGAENIFNDLQVWKLKSAW